MERRWDGKVFLVGMMGFLMSRVAIYGMYPVAVAFFVTAYAKNKLRGVVLCSVALGLATSISGPTLVKYGLAMVVTVVINHLMERAGRRPSHQLLGVTGAAVTFLLSSSNLVFQMDRREYVLLSLLEATLIVTVSYLFSWGLDYWLYETKGRLLGNEQMISVVVMASFALYGLPEGLAGFLVRESLAYLMILFVGYKYGSGAGAMSGTAVGLSLVGKYGTSYMGIYCILGVLSGLFRELGRLGSGLAVLLGGVVVQYAMGESGLQAEQLAALASGCALFLFLPRAVLYIADEREGEGGEDVLARQNYQDMAREKLKEFSDAFRRLSDNFSKTPQLQDKLGKKEVVGMFDKLSKRICTGCDNTHLCWERHYYDTYHEALSMVRLAEEYGTIQYEDVSPEFAARCLHFDDFVRETSQSVEYAKWNLNWSNKLAESRTLIAEQLSEVANIINEFSEDLCEIKEVPLKQREELLSVLRAARVKVGKLSVVERRGRRMEVHLTARTGRGDCITAREVAGMIGEVVGGAWRAEASMKNVLPKEYGELVFVEDVGYRALTGMARITKDGERVSGDAFSFLPLGNGELIMVLSDGMGTGYSAYRESEAVVELLENLLEAGFREESAIKLINSVLVLQSDRQGFSTLDISVINLHTGNCEFIKNGASATFVKREGWIETIESDALPVGMLQEARPEGATKKLYHGDLVVMVTDGVMDCFPDEDKEFYMENLLMNVTSNNPQEVANSVMNHALEKCRQRVTDDMSVMVAGIWEKRPHTPQKTDA